MTLRTAVQYVGNGDGLGEVRISHDDGDRVTVTWFCGDQREFDPEDLAHILGHIDDAEDGDVLHFEDSDGKGLYVVREPDGQLWVSDSTSFARGVSWRELRRALRRCVRQTGVV